MDSNPCQTNPCLHGGSCLQEGDGYSCYCPQGFSGESCEIGESLGKKKKKKSTPLRDPKTQRSAAADCWVTVTRGRCVGGGGEKHMLSSAPACVSANEFSRTCGGRRKAEEVFPREFFSPSVCLFVSALNAESGVPVSSTPGCSSPAADKMGICKS